METPHLVPPPLPTQGGIRAFTPEMTGLQILQSIFIICDEKGVSDIQMRSNRPVYIETNIGMESLLQLGELSAQNMLKVYKELLNNQADQSHGFEDENSAKAADPIAYSIESFKKTQVDDFSCNGIPFGANGEVSGRLRIQAHLSDSGLGITCRILNDNIPDLSILGIGEDTVTTIKECLLKRAGLCLITGPTGSGKSTSLAAMMDWVRKTHAKHIVTVEDPVEYQYPHDMEDPDVPGMRTVAPSIVTQQEVGRDLESYRQGLKDVLRKAPHIILLGEIRDREAMETCMEAAQTGHLVLSTLHTTGAVKTMGRILEMFPRDKHESTLRRLSEILLFIHSQGLLKGYERRVLNYEFLHNNDDAVSASIASYDQNPSSLEDSIRRAGNVQWDAHLLRLYEQGIISPEAFENTKLNKSDNDGF